MLLAALLTTLSLVPVADSLPKPFSLVPLPLVYYTPETRLAYGIAATATFRFGSAGYSGALQNGDSVETPDYGNGSTLSNVRPSQVTLGIAYTQNKQLLFYLPFQIFSTGNAYYLNGEAGYYRYTYYFYGLGQQETDRELYGVNFPRIRLNAFRRIIIAGLKRGNLYAGIRYQYEDYRVTSTQPGGLLAGGTVAGGAGSRLSGAGLGLFYDTRDRVFYPTRGVVADLTYLHQDRVLGGNVCFDRYVADLATYHRLGRQAILALNYVVSMTTGTAPFNALSLLGGTKRMRGYYEGRFRDANAALLQTELRFTLGGRLGGVVFGAVGLLGDDRKWFRPDDPKAAYGGGLRFVLNRRDHLNLRLDYGRGRGSSGFYLTVGESF